MLCVYAYAEVTAALRLRRFSLTVCECHAHYLPHINDVSERVVVVIVAECGGSILRVKPLTFEFMHIWRHGRLA